MAETPETQQAARKRRWFQFHLSTLIVLTLVAGGLLALQFQPRSDRQFHGCLSDAGAFNVESYGWPFPVLWSFTEQRSAVERQMYWNFLPVLLNGACIATLLTGIAFTCEKLFRRRR